MDGSGKIYVAIDLKSFYASVECVERGLNPLTTNLVVADTSRTEKTICLAVSPALKSLGIGGRPRLFEVVQKVNMINAARLAAAPGKTFRGESYDADELKNPALKLTYIAAVPHMAHYLAWSTKIYQIYLKYIAPEDIHVYSIDEVMIDLTSYLKACGAAPRQLVSRMISDILQETGITATAGIGTNLYLCKVAMDIMAKRVAADASGVRIAELDELSYRKLLWEHRPLTDFWRVGKGYAQKLEAKGIFTMGDIARCSLGGKNEFYNEELLYKMFGVNAQLLIDHAWGWEPCSLQDIKSYKPRAKSMVAGQVLQCAYDFAKTRLVVLEMADQLALDLFAKKLAADQLVMTISYDVENLKNSSGYAGEVVIDAYGRRKPKHAHGTIHLPVVTASSEIIRKAALELFHKIIDRRLLCRKVTITACNLLRDDEYLQKAVQQLDLFADAEAEMEQKQQLVKEKSLQAAILAIKRKYGKNSMLKGINFMDGATMRMRNEQIGGHKA